MYLVLDYVEKQKILLRHSHQENCDSSRYKIFSKTKIIKMMRVIHAHYYLGENSYIIHIQKVHIL